MTTPPAAAVRTDVASERPAALSGHTVNCVLGGHHTIHSRVMEVRSVSLTSTRWFGVGDSPARYCASALSWIAESL